VSTELADYVAEHDKKSRQTGGDTRMFGWPDGTTVVLTRDDCESSRNTEQV
jgi:hypothetical protein